LTTVCVRKTSYFKDLPLRPIQQRKLQSLNLLSVAQSLKAMFSRVKSTTRLTGSMQATVFKNHDKLKWHKVIESLYSKSKFLRSSQHRALCMDHIIFS